MYKKMNRVIEKEKVDSLWEQESAFFLLPIIGRYVNRAWIQYTYCILSILGKSNCHIMKISLWIIWGIEMKKFIVSYLVCLIFFSIFTSILEFINNPEGMKASWASPLVDGSSLHYVWEYTCTYRLFTRGIFL